MPDPDQRDPSAKAPWLGLGLYLALLAGGGGLFLLVWQAGATMAVPATGAAVPPAAKAAGVDVFLHVMLTLAAVILVGTFLGGLCRRVGQPPVIGEVLAGIALGPSLLGAVSPDAMTALIPSAAADPRGQVAAALDAVAQLGIVLYMFLVGLELNGAELRKHALTAAAVSNASIVVPFVCGSALALALYPAEAPPGTPFVTFALFMGVAMSVTAFPVLARILTDRRLERTRLGTLALGCAAVGDVIAWCLLALIVGVAKAEVAGAAAVVAGAAGYVAAVLLVVRPLAARLSARLDAAGGPLPALAVPGGFVAILLSAIATQVIGIHSLFGAFLLGAVIPHGGRFAREFAARVREPVSALLLPAFFAYTGMRTQIGLVSTAEEWLWCGLIVLVATGGKFGGTFVAARLTGRPRRDAAALGVLMNTRGLMELIVLNVGMDLGVISPTLFAMLVVMSLVTTAATGVLLTPLMPPPGGRPVGEPPPGPLGPVEVARPVPPQSVGPICQGANSSSPTR